MALPPWAYQQRQRLAPIQLEGLVQAIECQGVSCRVGMRVSRVLRNRSDHPLHQGDQIQIQVVAAPPLQDPRPDQLPEPIGAPQSGVVLPAVGQTTSAWLRPSQEHKGTLELLAGPYGFGPDLDSPAHP